MKKSILFLAGAALLFVGCAKVEDEAPIPENGKRVVTLKATVNESDTRVSVESDGTYNWQAGDKIGVWVVDFYGGAPYPYTTQDSGTTANFEVSLDAGEDIGEYAFYPFSEDHFVSGEGPQFAMDADLQYVEDATNMPMLGTVSGGTISFKSVGGVIKLTVNNIPSDAAHLLFSAKDLNGDDLFISGVFPVSGDIITAGGIMGVNSVNIDFTDKWKSSMEFYVPLPTGTYGGFELEFDNANSSETLASKKVNFGSTGLTIERNQIIVAPALDLGNTPTQLIPDGVYAIALMGESHYGDIMMTALADDHQSYSALGTSYTDGKLSVPAESAWRMSYDASSSSYYILSMSEDKYLEGYAGGANLKLASKEADKTPFFITAKGSDSQGNLLYQISVRSSTEERFIGFNYISNNSRFSVYLASNGFPSDLRLIPAVAQELTPSISFTSTAATVSATAPSATFYYTAEHLISDPSVRVTTDDDHIVSSATVNTTDKQIVVNLNPNTESTDKTATLTVSCEGANDIVLTVNQNGKIDIVEDVITKAFTEIPNTSYNSWSGKQGTSGAVYAGYSAGTNDSVQLKSGDNSGIVSTGSGGKIKTISVVWESHTSQGRTLNVYGKNSAYSSASDLYNTSEQGTLLGSIVMGSSTTLTVSGNYDYVGLVSDSGAMWLSEIRIGWESGSGPSPTTPTMQVSPGNGSTLSWGDSEFGNETAKHITVALNDAATGYNVNYSDPDNLWTVDDDEEGTITVYPNAANTSTTNDKELAITITHKDQSSLSATVSLLQSKKSAGVTDIITADKLVATGSAYADFSNVSDQSNAKYAGNSAKNDSNIQLRSSGSNSGIVSTVSGGKVKRIKITVASGEKTIDVYGNNNAYTAASELFATGSNSNQGTKLGSLSATGTITVTGDYQYVGIRSNSGAVYISSIEITWE